MRRFDSIINAYLVEHCGLHPPQSDQIGLVVHSHCDFFGSVAFPEVLDLALCVNKLGKSSVTYEIAVFKHGAEDARAVGEFIHVFVDRRTSRPATNGMSANARTGLEKIRVQGASKL